MSEAQYKSYMCAAKTAVKRKTAVEIQEVAMWLKTDLDDHMHAMWRAAAAMYKINGPRCADILPLENFPDWVWDMNASSFRAVPQAACVDLTIRDWMFTARGVDYALVQVMSARQHGYLLWLRRQAAWNQTSLSVALQ